MASTHAHNTEGKQALENPKASKLPLKVTEVKIQSPQTLIKDFERKKTQSLCFSLSTPHPASLGNSASVTAEKPGSWLLLAVLSKAHLNWHLPSESRSFQLGASGSKARHYLLPPSSHATFLWPKLSTRVEKDLLKGEEENESKACPCTAVSKSGSQPFPQNTKAGGVRYLQL